MADRSDLDSSLAPANIFGSCIDVQDMTMPETIAQPNGSAMEPPEKQNPDIDAPDIEGVPPPRHIFDLLRSAASSHPSNGMKYLSSSRASGTNEVSYASLLEQAQANALRIRKSGIFGSKTMAITYFDNHSDNVLWFWSVIAAGGICAVLPALSNEAKTAAAQLENVKKLFGQTPVITSHRLLSQFATSGLNVETVESIEKSDPDRADSPIDQTDTWAPHQSADDIAVILFTSGSTGPSKAVQFSHRQLMASVEAKASHLSTHGKSFMSWVSFDHSACFCEIHLQAMFVGSKQVFVHTSDLVVEPYQFYRLLSAHKIGYTFAPNFFLAAATRAWESQQQKPTDMDLSNLAVIMCGGEANRTSTLEAADALLRQYGAPSHVIKAAYGLSETCAACFYNLESPRYDVISGNTFASVGQHLPGVLEMKLVCEGDVADTSPREGVVHLRGELIFKGYYGNADATAACMTADGWMNTGDIGRIDSNGNLHLLGRSKEVLILYGQNYSSFEIENAIESCNIPGLTKSYTAALSSWDHQKNSEGVVILFNPTEAAIGPKNLHKTVVAIEKAVLGVCSQQPLQIIPLPKVLLPKSSIGKLSRAKLRQQFEAGEFDDFMLEQPELSADESGYCSETESHDPWNGVPPLRREIAEIYGTIANVPAEQLLGVDVLLSTGIDSIALMRLKRALEKQLKILHEIPMPLLLRCHSIEELEHELVLLGTVPQQYEPLVPLVSEGSKSPLFLLHPGGGEFLCWIGLLKFLPDRPIYALRARGLHPGEKVFESLDELLDCYYTAIRRAQPVGPYAMLGYCLGGLLCFELAKRFEAAGETISFCGGIDNPPTFKGNVGGIEYRSLIIDILPHLSGMSESEARKLAEDTASMTDDAFFEYVFATFNPEVIEKMDITVPRLQAWARVEDSMRIIIDQYVARGEIQTMDIFCADPMPTFGHTAVGWRSEVLSQWKNFVKDENVRFHEVHGSNHVELMKEPYIHEFQKALIPALEGRGV